MDFPKNMMIQNSLLYNTSRRVYIVEKKITR